MDDATVKRLTEESLATPWLATRLGVGVRRLDAMRRTGELLGVRPPGADDYYFPAWQFDSAGRPRSGMRRIVDTARAAGIDDERLYEVMTMRLGLGGTTRLADALREGRDEDVLRAVRTSA